MAEESAPYWRFRPSPFYDGLFLNGSYTADIMGCNWTREGCWSGYGWRGAEDKISKKRGGGVFTPSQVVDKLIRGMRRNAMSGCRISGGEVSMRWEEHIVPVVEDFVERTSGLRMFVGDDTPPEGVDMAIMLETNGGTLTVGQLSTLDDALGDEGRRVIIALGIKASNADLLADLTGQTPETADRFHANQMQLLRWLALKAKNLDWAANFLDEFAHPVEIARLQRSLERAKPGAARRLGVDPYLRSYNPNRWYTPKRFREEGRWFNEASPLQDEEVICKSLEKDGTPKDLGDATLSETPVEQSRLPLDEFSPEVRHMQEFEEATSDLRKKRREEAHRHPR